MAHIHQDDNNNLENVHVRPMFGDPFENRGDYSKGFFYKGRRCYLYSEKESNHLEPPEIFMNKQQKRRLVLAHTKPTQELKQMGFQLDGSQQRNNEKKVEKEKGKKSKKKIVYIQKFSSTDPKDWEEILQAGVKLYVNKATGEVFDECPWDPENGLKSPGSAGDFSPSKTINSTQLIAEDDNKLLGTGSLVYESTELEEVLAYLDGKK